MENVCANKEKIKRKWEKHEHTQPYSALAQRTSGVKIIIMLIIMKNELRIVSFHLRMLWHFFFLLLLLFFSLYLLISLSLARSRSIFVLVFFYFSFLLTSSLPFDFSFYTSAFVCCERCRCRSHHHFMIALHSKLLNVNIYLILFQILFLLYFSCSE